MSGTNWFAVTLLHIVALQVARPADIVSFKDLDRLPAGSPVTIQGAVKDVTVDRLTAFDAARDAATGASTLADLITVSNVKLTYTVLGLAARESTGAVAGDKWTVALDPLPENGSVTLSFEFGGTLSEQLAGLLLDRAMRDDRFQTLLSTLATEAKAAQADHNKDAAVVTQEVRKAVDKFVSGLLPVLRTSLPAFAKDSEVVGAPERLKQEIDSLTLLSGRLQGVKDMQPVTLLPQTEQASYARVAEALRGSRAPEAESFLNTWDNVTGAIRAVITASTTASMSVVSTSGVKDFEKYAGVDLGVAWIPGVEELRSFVTINVYLGPVEERPYVKGVWETVRQTVSLTGGFAFADVSGQNPERALFRSNNAFLVGLGVRLNKYFRIIGGTSIYRRELLTPPTVGTVEASLQGRLRTAGFVGASIDVTALPNLRLLFGKAGPALAQPVSILAPAAP